MATPVIMPRQGQSVESCIITSWHKQKGDPVKAGEVLFSYETDKASFEEEAPVDGILLDVFFDEDDDVPVLTNVCVIGEEGESTQEFNPHAESGNESQPEASAESTTPVVDSIPEATAPVTPTVSGTEGMVKISPRAKNLAAKAGVDHRLATATGPEGRIIERDIIQLIETGPVATYAAQAQLSSLEPGQIPVGTGLGGRITTADLAAPAAGQVQPTMVAATPQVAYEDVKLSNMRKVIAKAMHHSLTSTAQLTLHSSFDATNILAYRAEIKANKDRLGLENITINDLILFAVSRTLTEFKELNAHLLDDTMRLFNTVNLGVAVDTERGLMVPTIFNAEQKSLNQISKEAKQLIEDCQKGSINPDYLTGGTFTVTNLGTLDVEYFTPVLNAPQTGILGVSTIVQKIKVVDGEYVHYPSMNLSLTFDHRALDGAPAARFLKTLKTNLESFSTLLAK